MGFIADEPLGDLLDEQGLDHAGKSLREQQRKAQAIDRDLPDNTGIDDHIADAFGGVDYGKLIREADAQRDAIKKAMGMNPKWAQCPDLYPHQKAGMDAMRKAYGGAVTGRDRFTIKGQYADLNDKELAQEWHDAMAAGNQQLGRAIQQEAKRRKDEGANA